MNNKKFNSKKMQKGMLVGALTIFFVISSISGIVVHEKVIEAKKKNTKPKLTLTGKCKNRKLTVKAGESVKVTAKAKDKEDGNLTKKIKIDVKKPKNGKYKKSGKTIKFVNAGVYKVTVSVRDSKKAKASETIKITVKNNRQESKASETPNPTDAVTATYVEDKAPRKIMVDDITYNVCNSEQYRVNVMNTKEIIQGAIPHFEKDYYNIAVPYDSKLFVDYAFLPYLGKIIAYDPDGNDISDEITVIFPWYEYKKGRTYKFYLLYETDYGYSLNSYEISLIDMDRLDFYSYMDVINKEPLVLGSSPSNFMQNFN